MMRMPIAPTGTAIARPAAMPWAKLEITAPPRRGRWAARRRGPATSRRWAAPMAATCPRATATEIVARLTPSSAATSAWRRPSSRIRRAISPCRVVVPARRASSTAPRSARSAAARPGRTRMAIARRSTRAASSAARARARAAAGSGAAPIPHRTRIGCWPSSAARIGPDRVAARDRSSRRPGGRRSAGRVPRARAGRAGAPSRQGRPWAQRLHPRGSAQIPFEGSLGQRPLAVNG